MRASLERLFGKPVHFPVEVTLSSGDKHLLPHPDHVWLHPSTKDLVLFPDEEGAPFDVVIKPEAIVSIRPLRRKAS
ncbi:MAG TPA: hypothetical protein VG838_12720 [Opitutaceae bacterium]|nr:hypothetical protein [Opitutaceae bacterium]